MKKFTLLFLLFVFVMPLGMAQEMLVPLVDMPLKRKDMEQRVERMRLDDQKNYRVSSMELPFIDDFSTDKFEGNEDDEPIHWLDHQVFRNYTFAKNPPSLGVVTFDGGDEYGYPYDFSVSANDGVPCDTLTSVPINLDYEADDNIWFSFFYQGGGFGETPDGNQGDSLTLEFYAPNLDQWFHAWSVAGSSMDEFEQVFVPITQNRYLRDGFQFRFVNYATPRGALDHFHIDYVQLDVNREDGEVIDDVSFVYPIRTLLESYSSMPWTHFSQNPSSYMADNIETLLFSNYEPPEGVIGNRTIFDRTVEISYEGVVQGTFVNPSDPPIAPQSFLTLTEPVNADPFNFVFDTSVDEVAAVFDVTISNSVSPDFIPENNTIHMRQEFYSNYGYDDGSAESGYFVQPTGSRIAMRYANMKADSLVGLMIWLVTADKHPAGGANSFFPMVWADGGTQPGNDIAQGLWEAVEIEPDTTYGWRYFEFLEPVFLSEGAFYVGIVQSTDDRIFIGLDKNSNWNPGNLFYYNPNWGIWSGSSIEGSLMLRPVFQSSNIGPVDVPEETLASARIFPNPVTDQLFVETGHAGFRGVAEVLDLTGKVLKRTDMHENAQWNMGDLPRGMYMLRLASNDGAANRVFKFVKQ